jgi:hypothetical protein
MASLDLTHFSKFLGQGEKIVLCGLVNKRRHFALSCQTRVLILTSNPRLIYVDPDSMQLKGEVPWDVEHPINVLISESDPSMFDVLSPLDGNRAYHFESLSNPDSKSWEVKILAAVDKHKSTRLCQDMRKDRACCAICRRSFGIMRRNYLCRVCSKSVCADCSEAANSLPPSNAHESSSDNSGAFARCCEECSEYEAMKGRASLVSSRTFSSQPNTARPNAPQSSSDDNRMHDPHEATEELRRAPFQPNRDALVCNGCSAKFGMTTLRQHHCRSCGLIFCKECSSSTFPLKSYSMYPQRGELLGRSSDVLTSFFLYLDLIWSCVCPRVLRILSQCATDVRGHLLAKRRRTTAGGYANLRVLFAAGASVALNLVQGGACQATGQYLDSDKSRPSLAPCGGTFR